MKMGESEAYSMQSFNTFVNTQSRKGGNYFNNETDGKKYKLRLKFDGACVLEVVRLNGGHFQVGKFNYAITYICNSLFCMKYLLSPLFARKYI